MFLKNKNIIFKIRRSKVTDNAALNDVILHGIFSSFQTCFSSFRVADLVISSFRLALFPFFRVALFLLFRLFAWPQRQAKRRNNEMAQTSHH